MLFPEATTKSLDQKWRKLEVMREEANNHWLSEWDAPYGEFEEQHRLALEEDTSERWRSLAIAGRKLREAMRKHRYDPDYHPPYFEKLTDYTDAIESMLETAAHIPANIVPPEHDELIERITRLERQVDEERQATFEKILRERLDEASGTLAESKRTLIKIDRFSVINIDPASVVALIRDALHALKHGIDLLNDERFTEPLRKRAKIVWLSAKRFVQATKRRFTAFKLPWLSESAIEKFEGKEPDFHITENSKALPDKVFFKVRAGQADKHIGCVPGKGVSFRDRWEHKGQLIEGPEMVVIPAGEFVMGSPEGQPERSDSEGPQHRIIIAEPFAIGRFPVTFAEWDACRSVGGIVHVTDDEGWGREDRPVINVSWEDTQCYLEWLREMTGKTYRLPSEAEWEYAARAGSITPFWWGGSISTHQANYDGNLTYVDGRKGESCKKTLPVRSFEPNPWGLYQVHGNVWEWCEDAWHDSYKDKPEALKATGDAWTSGVNNQRVLRGGSWNYSPQYLRSAARGRYIPNYRLVHIGFRLARTLNI